MCDTTMTPREYFKAKFRRIQKTGCIQFRHKIANKDGYPVIKRNRKQYFYTRYVWEKINGPIPKGLVLRHTCDNPACVNRDHLLLGTHADNVADRVARGRSAKGERNGRAKLTEDAVRFIRNNTTLNNTALSKIYHVDRNVIRYVKTGQSWKHVTHQLQT